VKRFLCLVSIFLTVLSAASPQVSQEIEAADDLSVNTFLALSSLLLFGCILPERFTATAVRPTWAFARLSSLLGGSLTAYSSTRDITITSESGQSKTYDLFTARRHGDLNQNPHRWPQQDRAGPACCSGNDDNSEDECGFVLLWAVCAGSNDGAVDSNYVYQRPADHYPVAGNGAFYLSLMLQKTNNMSNPTLS
jgi:hypothetical protein